MPVALKTVKKDMETAPKWSPGGIPRDPDKYDKFNIQNLESLAAPGIKSLTYKATVRGSTANYIAFVQFFGVDFKETKDQYFDRPQKFQGKIIYHRTPSVKLESVKLKCSCPDFRFTWEKPLFDSKGLIGTFRRYKRKTTDRPPRNKDEVNGYCKHINSLLLALRNAEHITG